ncbi:hypothetical protein E4U43_006581 [Claviceps pusilla]|uniref:Uncharacterized protein n=1 Tax=Claviceps pusilla TaxID=123648 RepID=A0A9P7N1M4_9HYPO|nr:hypothetical protein E4U43_006581 [Claviceps pusilla]
MDERAKGMRSEGMKDGATARRQNRTDQSRQQRRWLPEMANESRATSWDHVTARGVVVVVVETVVVERRVVVQPVVLVVSWSSWSSWSSVFEG